LNNFNFKPPPAMPMTMSTIPTMTNNVDITAKNTGKVGFRFL
jgi:hypothetical protein